MGPGRYAVAAAVAAALLLSLTVEPAGAAVVEVRRTEVTYPFPMRTVAVTFEAAAGEVNRVTLRTDGTDFVFSDAGAPLTAGSGCRAEGPTVRCSVPDPTRAQILLGDGADSADAGDYGATAVHLTLDGGPGDDAITGSAGRNDLLGGRGDDRLVGGEGDDLMFGDDFGRATPDAGADHLDAGGGDDTLLGGAGPDTLLAGPGDDQLDLLRGDVDRRVNCGAGGGDRVYGPSAAETLRRCERAAFERAGELIDLPPPRRRRHVRVRFECAAEDPATCAGKISAGGRAVRFANRTGRPITLRVPVGRLRRRVVISVAGTARYRRCDQCTLVEARISGRVAVRLPRAHGRG